MDKLKTINMSPLDIKTKTVVIIRFGAETPTSGMRPSEYYQVTVDPSKVSPSGEYIRFGNNQGDEILGWQKVSAMTVLEVLGEWEDDEPPSMTIGTNGVTMLAVE